MTLHLGILLALLCAFASNLGFFFKHRGCCEAPTIDVRHPLRSAKGLWCSKWFAIGMAVGGGAWALHVAAISLAPLSVVQVVLSGGVEVIAITGTAANISCIAGGIIVFGDPMPGTALGIVVQAFAFVLVVTASALTPAPVRSAERAAAAPVAA